MASKKVHVDEKEPHYKVANKVTGNALAINAMNATKRFLLKSKVNTRRRFFCSNACSSWLRVVDKFEGFVLRREWKKQWILCWKHTKSGKEKKGCSATEELSIFDSISFRQTKICGSREEVVELKNKWFKLKARNDYKYKWQQWGCSWKFSVYLFFILLISLLLSMLPHLKHKRRN